MLNCTCLGGIKIGEEVARSSASKSNFRLGDKKDKLGLSFNLRLAKILCNLSVNKTFNKGDVVLFLLFYLE